MKRDLYLFMVGNLYLYRTWCADFSDASIELGRDRQRAFVWEDPDEACKSMANFPELTLMKESAETTPYCVVLTQKRADRYS